LKAQKVENRKNIFLLMKKKRKKKNYVENREKVERK